AGPITGIVMAARARRRAVVTLAGGVSIVAFILEDWRWADFAAKWRGSHARTLARVPGSGAPRSWFSVTETAKEMPNPQIGRPVRLLADARGGPVQHRESWKARKRFRTSDYVVSEHRALSVVLEDLATIDEVSVANLVGVERLVRKMQLIEHFWEEKQRGHDTAQQRLPQEEISALMGGTGATSRPGSMVCPALLGVVRKELERVSQLKKNARELWEEAKAASGAEVEDVRGRRGGVGAERQRARAAGAFCAAGGGVAQRLQRRCLARLAESVAQLGPPPGNLQPSAALRELQSALSYDGSLSTKTEAMRVSRLSLPLSGNRPAALERPLESE
ncbi:unnamed protein product, partial [Prorocentrum cordatum]